jgi:hypothetical protein
MGRIPDDRFRIFVSHKHGDAALARVVAEQIEGLSPVFECWVSGDDIASGTDWNRSIITALARSHLLVLIFTVPERNWDWCLYEAGLFTRFSDATDDDVRSVVPIFDPEVGPPRPLASIQGAAGEPEALGRFLTTLCFEPWELSDDWRRGPLDTAVDPAAIEAAAGTIAVAFRACIDDGTGHSGDTRYPCHRLVLEADAVPDGDTGIPDDARLIAGAGATSAYTLALFGLSMDDRPRSWGELLDRIGAHEERWRADLDDAYRAAARGELFTPGTGSVRAWTRPTEGERRYRPVLYSTASRDAGESACHQLVIVLDPLP